MGIGGLSNGLAVVSFPWWEMGLERVKSVPAGSWLAVGNSRKKKKKSKNRRRKKPQKTETQTNPTKIWGEGKEGKKKDGGGRKQEERGENEIKKVDNEKKKGGKKTVNKGVMR